MEEDKNKVEEGSFVSQTRRSLLKTAAVTGAGVTTLSQSASAGTEYVGVYYAPSDDFRAGAYRVEEQQYNINRNDYYRVDLTIDCVGGFTKANDTWGNIFRNHGTGALRRYDTYYDDPESDPNSERIQQLEGHYLDYIDAPSDNKTILYKQTDNNLGGWPAPQYTAMEAGEDIVENVAEYTLSQLSNSVAFALAAKNMWDEISQEYDEQTSDDDGNSRRFDWTYGTSWFSDKKSDTTNYNEFETEQPYDTNMTFYSSSGMYEGQIQPEVEWEVTVEAPTSESTAPSTSTTSGSTSKGGRKPQFSPKTKKRFGLRKVPIQKLRDRGLPIENPLVVDGDKTWWASKPQGSLTFVK